MLWRGWGGWWGRLGGFEGLRAIVLAQVSSGGKQAMIRRVAMIVTSD